MVQFREVPVARAVQDGRPVIYFANTETGTFTIVTIIKSSGGLACPIASGTHWLAAEVRPNGAPL